MPQGFEAYNEAGIQIVDNVSPVLALCQKTNIAGWTGTLGDLNTVDTISISYVGITDSIPVPVVYVNGAVHGTHVAGVVSQSRSGNTWTYVVGISYPEYATRPSPNGSVFLLIYDRPRSPSGLKFGFEAYDENALLVFSGATSILDGAYLKPAGLNGQSLPTNKKYGAIGTYIKIQTNYDFSENTDQTWTLSVREDVEGTIFYSGGVSTNYFLAGSYLDLNASGGGSSSTIFYGVAQDPVAADVSGTI